MINNIHNRKKLFIAGICICVLFSVYYIYLFFTCSNNIKKDSLGRLRLQDIYDRTVASIARPVIKLVHKDKIDKIKDYVRALRDGDEKRIAKLSTGKVMTRLAVHKYKEQLSELLKRTKIDSMDVNIANFGGPEDGNSKKTFFAFIFFNNNVYEEMFVLLKFQNNQWLVDDISVFEGW